MNMISVAGLIGAAMGFRFNVYVLVVAVLVALSAIVGVGIVEEDGTQSIVLTAVLVGTALQIGFLAGAVGRATWQSWVAVYRGRRRISRRAASSA